MMQICLTGRGNAVAVRSDRRCRAVHSCLVFIGACIVFGYMVACVRRRRRVIRRLLECCDICIFRLSTCVHRVNPRVSVVCWQCVTHIYVNAGHLWRQRHIL